MKSFTNHSALFAVLIVLPFAFPVQAADKASPENLSIIPKEGTKVSTLECCQCTKGSTTLSLSTIQNSNWTVSNSPDPNQLGSSVSVVSNITPGWKTPDIAPQGTPQTVWVTAPASVPATGGKHWYKFRFKVQDCTIGQTVNINIKTLRADNAATVTLYKSLTNSNIVSDWSPFPASGAAGHLGECGTYHQGETRPEHCFTGQAPGVPYAAFFPDVPHLAASLTPAYYTMVVEVLDTSAVATGLLIDADVTGKCHRNLVKNPRLTSYPVDNYDNGKLTINAVDVTDGLGGKVKYKASLSLKPLSNPLTFTLDQADQLQPDPTPAELQAACVEAAANAVPAQDASSCSTD